MKTLVFTGGGTAGHVMPNIYLLEDCKNHFDKIFYIGRYNGIEKEIAQKYGIEYYGIPSTKFDRTKLLKNIFVPFLLLKAKICAKKILKRLKPTVIMSKGGYVSLPVCMAAKNLKIPIVSHESDYSLGLANKLILKLCNTMCVNFEHLQKQSPKIVYTGAIISSAFDSKNITKTIQFNISPIKKTLLIIGGSQGAKAINEAVFNSLSALTQYNIIHLVGKGNSPTALQSNLHPNYNVFEYFDNMPYLYSVADLVIGRAGAGVVFESAYMHKPMLLIPLQNSSTRGDQIQNANYFSQHKCAMILPQSNMNTITLSKYIGKALFSAECMKQSLKKLDLCKGREKVLTEILKLTK
ncbi:MAG: undecaprenyldiphospho-muramoylpentapeptide beta-N-acetylglucosaminyltransferase [Clostridia bacterium]|nr:undecaprenyldiphospho-muramoylpentapeptide beta-N-acetylglucosaminyltransferase [Clostridia bacterium]